MNHEEREHALLGASAAHRWLNCIPSAKLEDRMPDEESEYSKEGTFAHEVAESLLRIEASGNDGADIEDHRELMKNELWSEELDKHVEYFVEYCLSKKSEFAKKDPSVKFLIEEKVDLSAYIPEGFGIVDYSVFGNRKLCIIDMKFGLGIKVNAVNNEQLRCYALGIVEKYEIVYEFDSVEMVIVQPRLDHISSDTISVEDLKKWGRNELAVKANLAFNYQPGKWCQFCKAGAVCRTRKEKAFDVDATVDCATLNDEEIVEAWKQLEGLKTYISTLDNFVRTELLKGRKLPGLKLVHGRSKRVWKDEKEALKMLRKAGFALSDLRKVELKSLTEIEKLVGKKAFAEFNLTEKPSGKPTVAHADDARLSLAEMEFSEPIIED